MCHMSKLHDMYHWGKYANKYAIYKLTGINHVARSAVNTENDAYVNESDDNAAQLHYLSIKLFNIHMFCFYKKVSKEISTSNVFNKSYFFWLFHLGASLCI